MTWIPGDLPAPSPVRSPQTSRRPADRPHDAGRDAPTELPVPGRVPAARHDIFAPRPEQEEAPMLPTFAQQAQWEHAREAMHTQGRTLPLAIRRDLLAMGWWPDETWQQWKQFVQRGIEPL